MILNELLTNVFRHAFPGGRWGKLIVRLVQQGEEVSLRVEDDGVGLDGSFVLEEAATLGMQLMAGLASQLKGTLAASNGAGASFVLTFPQDITIDPSV